MEYNKNKLHKTLDHWSKDMLNFDFLEKGLGSVAKAVLVSDGHSDISGLNKR